MAEYAVMGNPVAHSLSPAIHAYFAELTGKDVHYSAIEAPLVEFEMMVANFRTHGGAGLNITVPFKQRAFSLTERLSERARRAEAVNTLKFTPGEPVFGDTTDGIGLLSDLRQNLGICLTNQRILLLGAGGAASSVVQPLLESQPALLMIANRTRERADHLQRSFTDLGPVQAVGLAELGREAPFNIVINATSTGLSQANLSLPDDLLTTRSVAYDLMYSRHPTPFMDWAQKHGAERIVDGLGMLVEQAAESFIIWHGIRPPTQPVIDHLRHQLNLAGD